jgi:hypothetical protein
MPAGNSKPSPAEKSLRKTTISLKSRSRNCLRNRNNREAQTGRDAQTGRVRFFRKQLNRYSSAAFAAGSFQFDSLTVGSFRTLFFLSAARRLRAIHSLFCVACVLLRPILFCMAMATSLEHGNKDQAGKRFNRGWRGWADKIRGDGRKRETRRNSATKKRKVHKKHAGRAMKAIGISFCDFCVLLWRFSAPPLRCLSHPRYPRHPWSQCFWVAGAARAGISVLSVVVLSGCQASERHSSVGAHPAEEWRTHA